MQVSISSFNQVSQPWIPQPFLLTLFNTLSALIALSRLQDRAVATSTRNLMRAFGSVISVAISNALQFASHEILTSHQPPDRRKNARLRRELERRRNRFNIMGIRYPGREDEGDP